MFDLERFPGDFDLRDPDWDLLLERVLECFLLLLGDASMFMGDLGFFLGDLERDDTDEDLPRDEPERLADPLLPSLLNLKALSFREMIAMEKVRECSEMNCIKLQLCVNV